MAIINIAIAAMLSHAFVIADVRTWSSSVSLTDPTLWMDGRLPCPGGQRVVLPETVASVPAGADLALGPELVLPADGMIVFPNAAAERTSITLHDTAAAQTGRGGEGGKCDGDAFFKPGDYKHWHDPSHWSGGNAATPHLRQIPCRHDQVVFPEGMSYKVSLAHVPINVGRLSINGRPFNSVSFRALRNSVYGRLMFQQNTSLTVHQDRCMDPRGCQCGTLDLKATVCDMKSMSCSSSGGGKDDKKIRCSGGIRPKEHCCFDVCGAIVHVETYGNDVKMSTLQQVATAQTTDDTAGGDDAGGGNEPKAGRFAANSNGDKTMSKPSNVDFSVSRVGDDEYELVFVDRTGDIGNGIAAARRVREELGKRLEPKGVYLWVEESGVSPPSALRAAGKALGVIVAMGVIIGLLYLLGLVYLRKSGGGLVPLQVQRWRENVAAGVLPARIFGGSAGGGGGVASNLPFAKFSNQSGGQVEMSQQGQGGEEEDPRVEVLDPITMTMRNLEEGGAELGVHRSFANPLFDVGTQPAQGGPGKPEVVKEETAAPTVEVEKQPDMLKLVSIEEVIPTNTTSEETQLDKTNDQKITQEEKEAEVQVHDPVIPPPTMEAEDDGAVAVDPIVPPPMTTQGYEEPDNEDNKEDEDAGQVGGELIDI